MVSFLFFTFGVIEFGRFGIGRLFCQSISLEKFVFCCLVCLLYFSSTVVISWLIFLMILIAHDSLFDNFLISILLMLILTRFISNFHQLTTNVTRFPQSKNLSTSLIFVMAYPHYYSPCIFSETSGLLSSSNTLYSGSQT